MAAKKKGSSGRRAPRRGVAPLIAGLTGALAVALVALQLLPERRGPAGDEKPPSVRTGEPARPETRPSPAPRRAEATPEPSRAARPEPAAAAPAPVDAPERRPAPRPVARPADHRPGLAKVAIVIDDCGYDLELMKRFARLRIPITFAVIPHLEYSESSALAARAAGQEVILHQPMEPEGYPDVDPGEGAILRGMAPAQVARIVRANLEAVPHVSGLNNHMGSAATADPLLMGPALAEVARLRDRYPGLYFLDSRTSAATVAYDTARRNGLPTAMRSVFLDHDESLDAVRGKLDELLTVAEQEGEAIGIGHVKGPTLTALEAMVATVGADEFHFVFASELAR